MSITIRTNSGEAVTLPITVERYYEILELLKTKHIQDICPELPPCHKELFISGLGPHEFANLFRGACTNWEPKQNQCIYYKENGKCLYDDIKLLTEEQLDDLMMDEDPSDQARDYEDAKDIPGGWNGIPTDYD